MNVHEAVAAPRTIRDFDDRPIERDVLPRILDAGVKAPTHNHLREWHLVVVDDPTQRARLARFFHKEWTKEELEAWMDECGMEDECQRAMYADGVPKQSSMILGAGALVIPCFRQPSPVLAEGEEPASVERVRVDLGRPGERSACGGERGDLRGDEDRLEARRDYAHSRDARHPRRLRDPPLPRDRLQVDRWGF